MEAGPLSPDHAAGQTSEAMTRAKTPDADQPIAVRTFQVAIIDDVIILLDDSTAADASCNELGESQERREPGRGPQRPRRGC